MPWLNMAASFVLLNPLKRLDTLRRAVALAQEVLATSPGDSVYIGHVMRYRTELGVALAANSQLREAILTLESVDRRVR